jgi:hypothetical protein
MAALLLNGGVISLGITLGYIAAAGDGFCFEKHRFCKGGFSTTGVSYQDYIPDFAGVINCHKPKKVR